MLNLLLWSNGKKLNLESFSGLITCYPNILHRIIVTSLKSLENPWPRYAPKPRRWFLRKLLAILQNPVESGRVRPSPTKSGRPGTWSIIRRRPRGQLSESVQDIAPGARPASLPSRPSYAAPPGFPHVYSGADLAGSIRQGAEDVGLQLLAPRGQGAALSAGQLLGDAAAAAAGAVPSAAAEMAL